MTDAANNRLTNRDRDWVPTLQGAFGELIAIALAAGEQDQARQLSEMAVSFGLWEHPLQRPHLHYVRGLTAQPLWDPDQFWFTAFFAEHFAALKGEIEAAMESELSMPV